MEIPVHFSDHVRLRGGTSVEWPDAGYRSRSWLEFYAPGAHVVAWSSLLRFLDVDLVGLLCRS